MVRKYPPDDFGGYSASSSRPCLPTFLVERGAGGVVRYLCRGQSRSDRRCWFAVSCDQPVSRLQVEPRLRRPDRALLRGDAADLPVACSISCCAVAGRHVGFLTRQAAWFSIYSGLWRCFYPDDSRCVVDPAVQSCVRPLSRTRALRSYRTSAELGHTARPVRSIGCHHRDRKS